jgi:hypothetical protein
VRRRLATNLALLLAGASLGATLPAVGFASPLDERIGVERFEASRLRRAGRKGTLELAAKKKKKKKKKASDESSATPGDADTSGSEDSGASDEDVQKAARVNPTPAREATPSDDQAVTSKKAPKGGGVTAEGEVPPPKESGPPAPVGRYLDLSVGGQAFSRSLTYHQQVTPTLREYQPRLLGDAVLALQYYPGAQFASGFVSNIGLEVNAEQSFGLKSTTPPPNAANYTTQIHDYNGGVRLRLPLESLTPFISVGYGDHAFKMTGANRSSLVLPDTDYKYVRAVVGLQVPLASGVSVAASGGYRYVLSPGDIKTTYFPHLNVGGVEANLHVGYALTSMIEARVGFDYRRYFYTFHSTNSDMFIVGGAVDQTYAGSLSLAITLGGSDHAASSSASSSSSEDAPPPPKKSKRPKIENAE